MRQPTRPVAIHDPTESRAGIGLQRQERGSIGKLMEIRA
jgi:hypothetical protein